MVLETGGWSGGWSGVLAKKAQNAGASPRLEGVDELSAAESVQTGVIGESSVEAKPGAGSRQLIGPLLTAVEPEDDFAIADCSGAMQLG